MIRSLWNAGDSRSQIACRRSIASGSGAISAGSTGNGCWLEKAVTCVLPSARGKTSTLTAAPELSSYSRNSASAGTSVPVS